MIRDDEGDHESTLVADYHRVGYIWAGFEGVFNGLRRDEFASSGLDEIFLAVGDEEVVVGVQVADVAGVEPAFGVNRFAGCVLIFVVALHHAGALGENFTVVGDANQHVGDGAAGAAAAILRIVGSENGRSFGEAIALVNGNSYGPEEFGEVFGKRSAARKDHAQFSARSGADFFVDEFIGNGPLGFQDRAGALPAGPPGCGAPGNINRPIE